MLRVGLDVTALLAGDAGVARYVRELGAAVERRDVQLVPFAIGRGHHADGLPAGTRRVRVPLRVIHRTWALTRFPTAGALAPDCDVVHTPDLVPPPWRTPCVLTVHDLVALEQPQLHPKRAVIAQQRQLDAARDRAAVVVAVSHATARTLCAHGVDPERIIVAPNGVTRLPESDRALVPADPYLLVVGTLAARKGLESLVAAFSRARVKQSVRLVLAGGMGWNGQRVFDAIERHGVGERVTFLGRVTDPQLAGLYEGSVAVCVPSIAEGFGLPVLEAAAAGVPVVASDIPVFHEIQGSIALYAPPGDEHAWAAALEQIVADEELRRVAGVHGREIAREYTWDRTAALTIAAYERAREAA